MFRYCVLMITIVMVTISCISCKDEKVQPTTSVQIVAPVDFGNGVYYFECKQAQYGASLSFFIGLHTELELIAMAADDYQGYGQTKGYFVYFKSKPNQQTASNTSVEQLRGVSIQVPSWGAADMSIMWLAMNDQIPKELAFRMLKSTSL
jgi:hypothetical protein